MTSCREVSAWIDTYVDGELPVDRAVDTESHVARCTSCAERLRFERAFRVSLRQSVRSDGAPSQSLRARLERAMIAERENARVFACTPVTVTSPAIVTRMRESSARKHHLAPRVKPSFPVASDVASSNFRPLSWRSLLPVAAAAAGAILWAGIQNNVQSASMAVSRNPTDPRLSQIDDVLNDLIRRHQAASARAQSTPFAAEMELPLQLPPVQDVRQVSRFPLSDAPENDSLVAVRGASSAYQVKGHRVTFFAYETGMAPLRARLQAQALKGHVVFVGKRKGYSVVTVEEGPVGYAMTSDLPVSESAELIASAIEARVPH